MREKKFPSEEKTENESENGRGSVSESGNWQREYGNGN